MQWKTSGNLIIAGQTFNVDAPIINWYEGPKWDATSEYCQPTATDPNPPCTVGANGKHVPYGKLPFGPYTQRYATRPGLRQYNGRPPLSAVQQVIKQFVIHHDGCSSADMCFSVLQNERGLSVHFLLDNDGTIYQTIDLALMAYHASEWNTASIGVEICNRGDAWRDPHYYDSGRFGPKRDIVPVKINGSVISAFAYTPAQMESLTKLSRALVRLLPNLPAEYPQSSPGQQLWDTMLPYASTFSFSGYIGHYHLWNQKWDPGPFDFKAFCHKLRGVFCFPVPPRKEKDKEKENEPAAIPQDSDELKQQAKDLYKLNEDKADGGFFPVGPWGESRLWHGGVHLVAQEGHAIFAPFPGRIVAARTGSKSAVGSHNFVLIRHEMTLGKARVPFYSLYMHLRDETGADAPQWMAGDAWKKTGGAGKVALLDEAVEAGTLIGHVGVAGPGDLSRAQVHVEVFSTSELFADWPSSPWTVIDGTAGGRFCEAPEVNDLIDTNHDGVLSKQELSNFYSGGGASALYYLVTQHVTEWTAEPAWADALRVPKDFKKLKPAEIDELVADQITPGLWWDAAVAAHCKLPADGVVFHYHPVSFLSWFNQQLIDANNEAQASGANNIDASQAAGVPTGITDDFGDKLGTSMRSSTDEKADTCNTKLTLEQLSDGFDTPECGP